MTRTSFLFASALLLSCLAQAQTMKPATRLTFREPRVGSYVIENDPRIPQAVSPDSITAHAESDPANRVEIKNRIVLKLKPGGDISKTLAGSSLKISRALTMDTFILQASDARIAVNEAERLAKLPEVLVSSPVMQRTRGLRSAYFYQPNDPNFGSQWHLEHRDTNHVSSGVDLNVRAAWPITRGAGIAIGIADDGVELTHPDLASRGVGMPHFNFSLGTNDGSPTSDEDKHATPVAGLAAAELNNQTGGAGVAPEAKIASWKIFNGNTLVTSDEQLMDMFQYASNTVAVQNHSWGYNGLSHDGFGILENIGIQNAIDFGRGGRGVVMVRSVPNKRAQSGVVLLGNANDDGYVSDPRVIAVGATLISGRVTSESDPGACILVAAPGGEFASPTLLTTDRAGILGYNPSESPEGDYTTTNGVEFFGTSAAAPQIAGIAALILSANTNLSYRDVQQILIFSARHIDLADPDLTTNGAGFRVSHNVGFGIPDAGVAVNLARNWINRPTLTNCNFLATNFASIPDDGLRVLISGGPTNLSSLAASPGTGLHGDAPTASLPLVDVGLATGVISTNLSGKAALIQRGGATFAAKIQNAAQAGASFAVIYNSNISPDRQVMTGTDFSPIPAVMINKADGTALHNFLLTNNLSAQIKLFSTNYSFAVTNTLICEQVGVRIRTDNLRRADIRVTLLSPMGTRSVLQAVNQDPSTNAPMDWTLFSTHHFFESSAGTWTISFSDENTGGAIAEVQEVELQIFGTPISDSDADGLDDAWENLKFGSLNYGPKDDPDNDGFSNAREQIQKTNPLLVDVPFQLDLSRMDESLVRLSWPGNTKFSYQVQMGTNVANLNALTNIAGKFPETEWVLPNANPAQQFFRVRATPNP